MIRSLALLLLFVGKISVADEASAPASESASFERLSPDESWAMDHARLDRGIHLLTPTPVRPHSSLVIIDHRNSIPVKEDPLDNLFGFDGGNLKIGLGLRVGLRDDLDVGVYRQNGTTETFDTYEFDARWRLFGEEPRPATVALRAGASLFIDTKAQDAVGGFCQLLLSRSLFPRLFVSSALLFHSDSTNPGKLSSDPNDSFGFGGLASFRMSDTIITNIEIVSTLGGYGADHPIYAASLKFVTHRHTFSLVLTNTQHIGADGLVTNSTRAVADTIVGFSITREID